MSGAFSVDASVLESAPTHWSRRPLWTLIRRRDVVNRPDEELLSVYRDYGVVPKSSRDDNFNQPSEDLSSYRYVRPGDLVLNKMKTWQGSLAVSDYEGIVSPAYFVCELSADVNPRFAHHLLRSRPYIHLYRAASKGIRPNQWDLPFEEFQRIPMLLPSLDEQRRIAEFLDEETARVDVLVDKKRKISALIEERAQAVIDEAAQGAMVRALDGRPMGIAGMKNVRLGAMAVVQSGFTMDAGRDNGADSVTLPYLRVANVLNGSLALEDIKEVTIPRSLAEGCTLQVGDVLMTEGGDPDKLGRGTVWSGDLESCLHQNAIFAVRSDSRLLPEYLALVTRTRYARSYFEMTASKSTGIAHTSSTKITGFRVPMLAVSEQRRVVHLATESLAKMEALREIADQQVSLLTERRQALITAAVTGQFDVTTARGVDTSGLPSVGGVSA